MHVHSCMIFSLRMPAANSSPMNTMFPSIRTRTVHEKNKRGKGAKKWGKAGRKSTKILHNMQYVQQVDGIRRIVIT